MKLGIVGSGQIVHDFLSASNQMQDVELVAISTLARSKSVAEGLAQKYQINKVYTDNEEMFAASNIDTVYIGMPNSLHFSIAKEALAAGKNVVCEKPLVETSEQVKELKKIADEHHVLLFEAMTVLYLENYFHLKEDLEKIGKVHVVALNLTQISSHYSEFLAGVHIPKFDRKMGGGALMDMNIYNINFCVSLFGQPKKITYLPTIQHDTDTSGILNLSYDDKQASLIAAKDAVGPTRSYIEGEKGLIYFDGPLNVLPDYYVQIGKEEAKRYNFNKYSHRMISEFNYFAQKIKNHDQQAADEAYEHSLNAIIVLEKAQEFLPKND